MSYQSVNPYNGETLKTFDELTDEQLEKSIATAATCFKTWRQTTLAQRSVIAAKAAAILRARVDEFASPVTLEMGKLIEQARGEVLLSADIIDYYAKNAEAFLAPQHLQPSSGEADVESSPFGVLLGIQPWNFPYYQLSRFAGAESDGGQCCDGEESADLTRSGGPRHRRRPHHGRGVDRQRRSREAGGGTSGPQSEEIHDGTGRQRRVHRVRGRRFG